MCPRFDSWWYHSSFHLPDVGFDLNRAFFFPCIFNDYRKTNTNIFHTEDAEKKSHADLADSADFLTTNDRTQKSQKRKFNENEEKRHADLADSADDINVNKNGNKQSRRTSDGPSVP